MDLAKLTLPTVTLRGRAVPLNVVHQDSGEEPESACANTLIGARFRSTTYQFLNMPPQAALAAIIRAIEADLLRQPAPPPALLTVVVAHFKERVVVDWDAAVSPLTRLATMQQRPSTLKTLMAELVDALDALGQVSTGRTAKVVLKFARRIRDAYNALPDGVVAEELAKLASRPRSRELLVLAHSALEAACEPDLYSGPAGHVAAIETILGLNLRY